MSSPAQITVWQTGHGYNTRLTEVACHGLLVSGQEAVLEHVDNYSGPVPSLSYGILRGTGSIYKDCAGQGVAWWNIDNGFFLPGHPHGYYRIGYCDLQTNEGPIDLVDAARRWGRLGISPDPWNPNPEGVVLVCPPTTYMADFYAVDPELWTRSVLARLPEGVEAVVRPKGTPGSIHHLFPSCRMVVVYNSNVALEALLAGVPAMATRGIVHDWNRFDPQENAGKHPEEFLHLNRDALFMKAAASQFTLDEINEGLPWIRQPESKEAEPLEKIG